MQKGTLILRTCNDYYSLFLHGSLAQIVEVAESKKQEKVGNSRNFKIKVGVVGAGSKK